MSTNGGYSWQGDRRIGRDWGRWAKLGWLDFYAAQVYTTSVDAFSQRAQKVISDIGQDCAVLIGIAAQWSGGKNKVETVLQEIEIARQLGVKGIVLFHGKALTDEYLAALKAGPFKEPAAMPTAKR